MPARQSLSADEWTAAAVGVLADGGLAAVAVEPIAVRLGTTKGSFYWHFANRDALLTATLERWERTETNDVIAQVDGRPPGAERLRWLLTGAMASGYAASTGARVELALQPTASHPLVAPVLERVTRRRLDYLSSQFVELGLDARAAHDRALLAYTLYLGHAQLAHATPSAVPADLPAYVETAMAVLTGAI